MKYIEEFRDRDTADYLVGAIADSASKIEEHDRRIRIMEVCGSHTMAIGRYGIRDVMPESVEWLSGPGCPVCVTSSGYIDAAIELAARGIVLATFGDMMRVPGSRSTLAEIRSEGARIEVCYSPMAALDLASAHPGQEVVFLGIGFETTVAPVVSLIPAAKARGVENLCLLTAFKLVPPALFALLEDSELAIDAFLCPAHVSSIIGSEAYRSIVEDRRIPCVVAGFEPLDILYATLAIVQQIGKREAELQNHYSRVVKPEGNRKAQRIIERYLEPCDATWRGLGKIADSALALREEFSQYDASKRLGVEVTEGWSHPKCACGEILKGKLRPEQCALFDRGCTPEKPVGPCMVSSEGSCAAAYHYSRMIDER